MQTFIIIYTVSNAKYAIVIKANNRNEALAILTKTNPARIPLAIAYGFSGRLCRVAMPTQYVATNEPLKAKDLI